MSDDPLLNTPEVVFTCPVIRPAAFRLPASGRTGWGDLRLSFTVGSPPARIGPSAFRGAVLDALNIWRTAVPFVFSETPEAGIISIESVPPEHGDGFDFTGRPTELAHAFGPVTGGGQFDGQVHLNGSRAWAIGSTADADVLTIVLHELGHALGIVDHLNNRTDAVMNGSFPPGLVRRALTDADVAAMRSAYGDLFT